MRIAFFTDTFIPNINGVVTSVVNFSKKLAQRGHQVMIITSKCGKSIHLHDNITVKQYTPVSLTRYPDFKFTLPSPRIITALTKFKPDIVHSNMPSFAGWQALMCARMLKIPIVATYHTYLPDFIGHSYLPKRIAEGETVEKIVWSYTRSYYNMCDYVISPTNVLKEVLERHGITKPMIVISNGVDLGKFAPVRVTKEPFSVVHVGRVSYEKEINILIDAFKLVLKKFPSAVLTIVGDGPDMQRLKHQAGKLLGNRIIFLGAIRHDDLPRIYSKAQVFATASTIETEGLVVLEAMACGLPIVGVDKLAIPVLVKTGFNGFVGKAHDAKEMAKNIGLLLASGELRERFGKESIGLADDYSLETTTTRLERLYQQLISS